MDTLLASTAASAARNKTVIVKDTERVLIET